MHGDLEEAETDDCTCDICGATGTAYSCESGCGYDLCQSCWGGDDEADEEATAALAAARQLHPEAEVRACEDRRDLLGPLRALARVALPRSLVPERVFSWRPSPPRLASVP